MRSDQPVGLGWMRRGGGGPSVLAIILWLNIGVFVLQYVFMVGVTKVPFNGGYEVQPWGATSSEMVFKKGWVWTLITYMFVHGGIWHILLNLLIIFACGRAVQMIAGPKHFLRIYFLAGVLGALLQMVFSAYPLVGASACAFGLLTALATMLPEQQVTVLLYFVLPLKIKLKYLAYALVGIAAISLVIDLAAGPDAGIPMVSGFGHAAHLGGALLGWLYVRATKLGGVGLTRESLMRQRERGERRADRRRPGRSKAKKAKLVSGGEGVPRESGDIVSSEIDPILDKINREGFGSLTEREKKILEAGSQQIADRANMR